MESWLTRGCQKQSLVSKVRGRCGSQIGGATGPGGKTAPSPWGYLLKICLINFWKGRGRDPSKAQKEETEPSNKTEP